MAVVVSDNKGYTQDEFKEYLKTTIASISSDVATNASNASTSETNASNYAKQAKDSASAASGAEDSVHQYSSSALQSATNASASETNAKTSETNAATSATNAEASNQSAKKWAESSSSPDGANDTDSSTGKTQSAKSWALAAKTSETNAANSARTLQADWDATDTTLQSYIKNKPSTWLTTNLSRPTATNGVPDYTMRSMIDSVRANRLAFLPADQIIIEQTVDGGVTWTDAGFDDAHKNGLFDERRNFILPIPQIDGKENALCGLRVTITGMKYNVPDGTAETDKYNYWNQTYVKNTERYCSLDSFYIWCSSASNRIKIKIEMATGNNASNWETFFSNDKFAMSGEEGSNCINSPNNDWFTFGGGTSQTSNHWNYRLTFMTTSNRLDDNITIRPKEIQKIISICGYGEKVWSIRNNLAYNDHLYAWDSSQNATFPANVTADTFKGDLDGNANTATKLATARTISLTGNASGSATFDGSGNVSIDTTVAQATKATQDGDGNVIASTYATKDYVQQLMNTLSTVSVTQDSLTKALSIK